jgi:hypothetical protein
MHAVLGDGLEAAEGEQPGIAGRLDQRPFDSSNR